MIRFSFKRVKEIFRRGLYIAPIVDYGPVITNLA